MKRILFILAVVGFCWINKAESQIRLIGERGIFTHHYIHPVLINPGATGFYDKHQLFFNYRNSWATFNDSPKTVSFSYDGPVGNRLGFGALFIRDDFASLETTKGQLALSYSITSEEHKIGFGLTTEFVQHSLSSEELGNPLLDNNDVLIQQALDGTQYFDASIGIYGMYDNHLVYGLTLPSLISSKISDSASSSDVDKDFGFIINLGYRFDVEDYDLKIEPSIFVKQLMLTPFHVDVNLKMDFLEDKLTGGLSYTVGADKRFGFLVGARVNKFGFYYSYNVSFHDFQQYNNGSHEFSLIFDLTREESASPADL